MPERTQKPVDPVPWGPKPGDGDGPRTPDVSRPDTKDLLKKMRKVDPNKSKRYRQRPGQRLRHFFVALEQMFSGAAEDFPSVLRRKGLLGSAADLTSSSALRSHVP